MKTDFPIFKRKINKKFIVYLDNASTTQKPKAVIKAVSRFYERTNANTGRGLYTLAQEADACYFSARKAVADFIKANPDEIVFTKGTTESVNLAAFAWGERNLKQGDVVVVTVMEHHSNFLPWQRLCNRKKAVLHVLPVDKKWRLNLKLLKDKKKVKIMCVAHVSNVLGTINDIAALRSFLPLSLIFVDAAQSIGHIPIDVSKIGCDFLAASSHKAYGPMGVGFLYISSKAKESLEPFELGGGMIESYGEKQNIWRKPPYMFEAGTPDVAGVFGFKAALDYINKIGISCIGERERQLTRMCLELFQKDKDITVYGTSEERGPLISFNVKGIHPHDLAEICDSDNVCVRAGHHCALPLHEFLGVLATARVSFAVYNSAQDILALIESIARAKKIFKR